MDRRNFIKLTGITGGGLLLSTFLPTKSAWAVPHNGPWEPNFFIRITPDNVVTLISTQLEIGQGTTTGLSMILADELGADWKSLKLELADGDKKYGDLQGTGGSNGLAMTWIPLRNAAATTRMVLQQAAANRWTTTVASCYAEDGFIHHKDSGQKFSFGELTEEASQLPLPKEPVLKKRSEFKLIGKPVAGHKQRNIATGKHQYSLDLKVPNMVYATIERSPVIEGRVKDFDDTASRQVPGVTDVFSFKGNKQERNVFLGGVRDGIVVVASSTWAAIQGKRKLKVQWDDGHFGNQSASTVENNFLEVIESNPKRHTTVGKISEALEQANEVTDINYYVDFQVNACMEPLNAIAHYKEGKVEIWAGTQAPNLNRERVAKVLDIPEEDVTVHPLPSGGGFGRRYYCDYVEEAALISRRLEQPVKVMWTREDTITTNRYHDLRVDRWRGVLDTKGTITALDYQGVTGRPNAYRPFAYDIPHQGYTRLRLKEYLNLPTSWRSVFAHHWIFSMESFMDELAILAKKDPVQFRLDHLNEDKVIKQKSENVREDLFPGRLSGVLRKVADEGQWGKNMPSGSGQGVAVCSYNTSYCALLAEVSVANQKFSVDKVVAAIDCGMAVNPSQVKAQVEGSIVWGMSALTAKIDIDNGRTKQTNFHDYPIPRIHQIPQIEVHIIENDFAPSGTGEPAVPVTAPAILNAIYAATGKRLRRIPIDPKALS